MRLSVVCLKCFRNEGRAHVTWIGEVLDDCSIVGDCPFGHPNVVGIQHPKFEVLFECAGHAFLDGYYRECVIGIATSLERFFEFYVRLVYRSRGLDEAVVEAARRPVDNMSERQRGAFGFTYLFHTGRVPDLSDYDEGKWKKLRNRATHKGYIPTREEAAAYGDWASSAIHRWMGELVATPTATQAFYQESQRGLPAVAAAHKPVGMTTLGYSTMVNTMGATHHWGKVSFQKAVQTLREDRTQAELTSQAAMACATTTPSTDGEA